MSPPCRSRVGRRKSDPGGTGVPSSGAGQACRGGRSRVGVPRRPRPRWRAHPAAPARRKARPKPHRARRQRAGSAKPDRPKPSCLPHQRLLVGDRDDEGATIRFHGRSRVAGPLRPESRGLPGRPKPIRGSGHPRAVTISREHCIPPRRAIGAARWCRLERRGLQPEDRRPTESSWTAHVPGAGRTPHRVHRPHGTLS